MAYRYSRSRPSRQTTLYVGDSLGVGTAPNVKGANADVRVGRPSSEGLNIVKRKGGSYDRIVFDLGTNDPSVAELRSNVKRLRRVARGKAITMATLHGPDAERKNAFLRKLARQGKITLVDTSGVELSGDGIHATGKGYKQRAKLVSRALRSADGSRPAPSSKPTTDSQARGQALLQYLMANHAERPYRRS